MCDDSRWIIPVWALLVISIIALGIVVACCMSGCKAQAALNANEGEGNQSNQGLTTNIPVEPEIGDIGDDTEQKGTVNINIKDGLMTIGAVLLFVLLLVLVLLRYRRALIDVLRGVSTLPLNVASMAASATKEELPKGLVPFVKKLAMKHKAYIEPMPRTPFINKGG